MSHSMRNFWEKKDKWLRTWNGDNDDNALQIDYIRVYSPWELIMLIHYYYYYEISNH